MTQWRIHKLLCTSWRFNQNVKSSRVI